MASSNIVNVSEADFEYEVLAFSQQIPVVVDFWAVWCAPCRALEPILEKLVEEAQGGFRLARVNVDDNPNLAKRYQVYSIPAVKAFRDGRVAAEFSGVRPEPQVREFLRSVSPSPADLAVEKGLSLLALHQPRAAEAAFRLALEGFESHPAALLGLSRSLIYQGKIQESLEILRNFPVSREYSAAETLRIIPEALAISTENAGQDASLDDEPLEAAYKNTLRLLKRGNLEAALDGLLDILRQDKRFRDGQARKVILAIFELLGENDPITVQYRSELASVLF
jgi:putative thioredoxin